MRLPRKKKPITGTEPLERVLSTCERLLADPEPDSVRAVGRWILIGSYRRLADGTHVRLADVIRYQQRG